MPACVTMSRQGRQGETGRLPRAIASGYRQSAQGRNTRRRESGPGGNQLPARPLVPRLCRVPSGGSNLAETRWAPSRRRQASPSKRGMHTAAASGLPYALDWARNLASHHAQRRERFVGGGHLTAGAPPCGAPLRFLRKLAAAGYPRGRRAAPSRGWPLGAELFKGGATSIGHPPPNALLA
jgi:hypothetical protein